MRCDDDLDFLFMSIVLFELHNYCFTKMLFALMFRILYKKEAKLIAVHKATYFKVPKGVMLGPGPFIEALESATGKKALFVGKPEPTFYCSVLKDVNSTAAETVMIGDVCSGWCVCVCVCIHMHMHARQGGQSSFVEFKHTPLTFFIKICVHSISNVLGLSILNAVVYFIFTTSLPFSINLCC